MTSGRSSSSEGSWGTAAERIAAEYLIGKGYVVRERNWRPKNSHLEIDIISQRDDEMIFVEVKARGDTDTDPADAVDATKIRRLVRAADIYLSMQPHDFRYRFDIITVSGSPDRYTLDHLPDAFLPPLSTR